MSVQPCRNVCHPSRYDGPIQRTTFMTCYKPIIRSCAPALQRTAKVKSWRRTRNERNVKEQITDNMKHVIGQVITLHRKCNRAGHCPPLFALSLFRSAWSPCSGILAPPSENSRHVKTIHMESPIGGLQPIQPESPCQVS